MGVVPSPKLSTPISNKMEHVFYLLGNQLLKKVGDDDKKNDNPSYLSPIVFGHNTKKNDLLTKDQRFFGAKFHQISTFKKIPNC